MTDVPQNPSTSSTSTSGPSRRQAVTALAAAGSLTALAACAPGSSGGSSASGDGTLRVSTWGNDSRLKLTQQAAAAFEKANPGIKVSVENSEWTSYWDKLATSTAANDSPDVIQMDEAYIAAYGTRGALLDLGTVGDDLDLSEMDSKVLDTGKVDGKLVGAPIGVGNFSVGVNPVLLQQAGIAMPDDKTWTWEQFRDIAAQVSAKLGAQGVVGFDMYGPVRPSSARGSASSSRRSSPATTRRPPRSPTRRPTSTTPTPSSPPAPARRPRSRARTPRPPSTRRSSRRTSRRSTCSSTRRSPPTRRRAGTS